MPIDPLVPVHTSVSIDNRVTIPKPYSDRLAWIKGTEVEAWLFLPEPGRYRLLSDEDVQNDRQLEPVRLLILQEKPVATVEASHAENLRDVAIVARLIPITVRSHKGSWRFAFSEEWRGLAPPNCNPRTISFLFSPEGFVEIWYTDVLRRALTPAWHDQR
jgi:hypothetical protein